jgi:hypothetical protein
MSDRFVEVNEASVVQHGGIDAGQTKAETIEPENTMDQERRRRQHDVRGTQRQPPDRVPPPQSRRARRLSYSGLRAGNEIVVDQPNVVQEQSYQKQQPEDPDHDKARKNVRHLVRAAPS